MRRIDTFKAPIRLSMRTDLHLARKVWHMGMGLMMAAIYMAGLPTSKAILLLGAALILDLFMETARLRNPALNQKILRFWGPIMRTSEVNKISGVPFYIAAALLSIAIFPKTIAILAILFLALGDPVASLVGILYGKLGPRLSNGKSLIGTSAGVLTCMMVTYAFLQFMGIGTEHLAILTLVGGLAGGAAEVLPLEVDDNFSIPIVSGFVLWLSFILLGV